MTPKRGDLVHVTTHDIQHGNEGWKSFEGVSAAQPLRFETVGWVIKVRKRTLTIAPLIGKDSAHCHYLLPRGGITSIRRLKP